MHSLTWRWSGSMFVRVRSSNTSLPHWWWTARGPISCGVIFAHKKAVREAPRSHLIGLQTAEPTNAKAHDGCSLRSIRFFFVVAFLLPRLSSLTHWISQTSPLEFAAAVTIFVRQRRAQRVARNTVRIKGDASSERAHKFWRRDSRNVMLVSHAARLFAASLVASTTLVFAATIFNETYVPRLVSSAFLRAYGRALVRAYANISTSTLYAPAHRTRQRQHAFRRPRQWAKCSARSSVSRQACKPMPWRRVKLFVWFCFSWFKKLKLTFLGGALLRFCGSNKYKASLENICAKSCGFCVPEGNECEDKSPKWGDQAVCYASTYVNFADAKRSAPLCAAKKRLLWLNNDNGKRKWLRILCC